MSISTTLCDLFCLPELLSHNAFADRTLSRGHRQHTSGTFSSNPASCAYRVVFLLTQSHNGAPMGLLVPVAVRQMG